jgi:molecular chaperone GrpE
MSEKPFNEKQTVEEQSQTNTPDGELEKLRRERDELFERLARNTADFQNSRRRLEADADQRAQYANANLIKALLPVLDNFERALAVDPEKTNVADILKGMEVVHAQWNNILRSQFIETIAPEPGTPFDPTQHEAVMQQESEYTEPTVTQTFAKGYALHGRTLRPAQVAVSKGS